MTIVVKIGGAALEDAVILRKCAKAVAELAQDGHRVAVVHGGGGALTRVLKQLGKQSEFVSGLRVTDAETRDAATSLSWYWAAWSIRRWSPPFRPPECPPWVSVVVMA